MVQSSTANPYKILFFNFLSVADVHFLQRQLFTAFARTPDTPAVAKILCLKNANTPIEFNIFHY